jgi:hypothetical protein
MLIMQRRANEEVVGAGGMPGGFPGAADGADE